MLKYRVEREGCCIAFTVKRNSTECFKDDRTGLFANTGGVHTYYIDNTLNIDIGDRKISSKSIECENEKEAIKYVKDIHETFKRYKNSLKNEEKKNDGFITVIE